MMNNALDQDGRYQATRRVTLLAAAANFFLTVSQIVAGLIGNSQALVADGVHTLSDLVADIIVLIAAKYANNDADENHPYGHARIETLGTVVLSGILLAVGAALAFGSVSRMLDPSRMLMPTTIALVASAVTLVAKEAMYQYTMVVARKFNSAILKANAWHHRSDAISSLDRKSVV